MPATVDRLGPNVGRGHLSETNDDDSIHIAAPDSDYTLCGESLAAVANAALGRPDAMEGCWSCLEADDICLGWF